MYDDNSKCERNIGLEIAFLPYIKDREFLVSYVCTPVFGIKTIKSKGSVLVHLLSNYYRTFQIPVLFCSYLTGMVV